jgi:tRNA 2-thiouridine synthesizing protein A
LRSFDFRDHRVLLANPCDVMYGRRAFDKGEMTEKTLNLRGLKCPLPTLRVRKALSGLALGDLLIAECTDPLTEIDIPNLINHTGDELMDTSRADKVISFRIRKR